jgi:hypothetical protein
MLSFPENCHVKPGFDSEITWLQSRLDDVGKIQRLGLPFSDANDFERPSINDNESSILLDGFCPSLKS